MNVVKIDEGKWFWERVYCYSTGTVIYFDAYAEAYGSSHARECSAQLLSHRSNAVEYPPFLVLCRAPGKGVIGTSLLGVPVI